MKYLLVTLCLCIIGPYLMAQGNNETVVDTLYKEDQFYIGVTYNLIRKKPEGIKQTGFSTGVHFGFIKDIPLNKNRNFGLGIGLGGSINSFNQNLLVTENNNNTYSYSVLEDNVTPFSLNKFYMNLIEVPLEFRWRTSTASDYKFWRLYSGIKFGYLISNVTKFESELNDIRNTQVKDFNEFQYGLSFSAGYNTWNFYFYYALNPIFNEKAIIEGATITTSAVKIGLLFYIL